jgi:peptidoglycan hydrolase-like protein with peptidoglycan-binding domain
VSTSQNGYPAGNPALLNTRAVIPGTDIDFPGGVRKGAVEVVLMYVAAQMRRRVEPTTGYGCWGYNYRPISGSTSLSNHSSGTAIDYNAPQHPLGVRGTWSAAERNTLLAIGREVGNVVRFGEFYTGRVDGMHGEINSDLAAVTRVAARIAGGSSASGVPTLRSGSQGAAVRWMQQLLWARITPARLAPLRRQHGDLEPDGVFGAQSAAYVAEFGRQVGVNNGGQYGSRTRGWLDPPLLKRGSTGNAVRTVQGWLNNRMHAGLTVDGDYGAATESAVRGYQAAQKIPNGGGQVGYRTWNALHRGSYLV